MTLRLIVTDRQSQPGAGARRTHPEADKNKSDPDRLRALHIAAETARPIVRPTPRQCPELPVPGPDIDPRRPADRNQ
ncbi:hypothetical protein D3C78_1855780 [compost metagenome]